jgi:raffinose/stachyose/melibiose transport system permease protein
MSSRTLAPPALARPRTFTPTTLVNYVVLGLFAIFALYPVLGIVLLSLQTDVKGMSGKLDFSDLSFAAYAQVWDFGIIAPALLNSLLIASVVTVLTVLISTLGGYAFGTMQFRGSTALFAILMLGMIFPYEAIIIPLYYGFLGIGLDNSYWAVILPDVALSVPFGTFWMRAFFRGVPRSLVEAARIDGASSWFTLWRVLLPLARPAVLTMTVLLFMWTWNEFLLALVMVSDEGLRTAPLGLSFFQGRNQSDLTLLAAGAVIVAMPVVLVYVFLQRHFIRGMLSGAVKG